MIEEGVGVSGLTLAGLVIGRVTIKSGAPVIQVADEIGWVPVKVPVVVKVRVAVKVAVAVNVAVGVIPRP